MKVKCGRKEFNLTKEDVIFDNSACYQILTREIFGRYGSKTVPIIAKTLAKNL